MKYIYFYAISILFLFTCERDFELILPGESDKLVVFAPFSDQEPFSVQLWQSYGSSIDSIILLDREGVNLTEVIGAQVNLYADGDFLERFEFLNQSNVALPIYQGTTIPKKGVSYALEIAHPDYPSVSSNSRIPDFTPQTILALQDITEAGRSPSGTEYMITAYFIFTDSLDYTNFYHLKVFQDVEDFSVNLRGDTSVVNIRRVEQSPSVTENDNNMVRSFDGGMLFNDVLFDGKTFTQQFWFTVNLKKNERLGKLHVQLRNTSEDYYLYYTSLSRQSSNPGPPSNEPVIVFNNVENGLGLFGGYSVSMDSVSIRE